MALSIKYHHADAYTLPKKYLNYFLTDVEINNLVVNIKPDSCLINDATIVFMTTTKYEKKIVWDLIKTIYLFINQYNKQVPLKDISHDIKQAIVDGLDAVHNTFSEGLTKEDIYKKFIKSVRSAGSHSDVQLKVLDIVETRETSNYRILIPCEILS